METSKNNWPTVGNGDIEDSMVTSTELRYIQSGVRQDETVGGGHAQEYINDEIIEKSEPSTKKKVIDFYEYQCDTVDGSYLLGNIAQIRGIWHLI